MHKNDATAIHQSPPKFEDKNTPNKGGLICFIGTVSRYTGNRICHIQQLNTQINK